MIEKEVAFELSNYFQNQGLEVIGKLDIFDHLHDADERSFVIDLAIGPLATKGNRSHNQLVNDQSVFHEKSKILDDVVRELINFSLFPKDSQNYMSWERKANPNPVVGIAIEIENCMTKYFLGSLLASAVAGRWGMVIIPDCIEGPRWINTMRRMLHKGQQSPIPSNVAVFTWTDLKQKLCNT